MCGVFSGGGSAGKNSAGAETMREIGTIGGDCGSGIAKELPICSGDATELPTMATGGNGGGKYFHGSGSTRETRGAGDAICDNCGDIDLSCTGGESNRGDAPGDNGSGAGDIGRENDNGDVALI
mmetsp:Transcript_47216/g.74626  ORF Transcript_47216/g.74626 Transcript_47216/m.74626 type:complete len:124 (+) Transcript_47216:534-905(+)